jgi:hypothetical protein
MIGKQFPNKINYPITTTPALATNHLLKVLFQLNVIRYKSYPTWMQVTRYIRRMDVD